MSIKIIFFILLVLFIVGSLVIAFIYRMNDNDNDSASD